MIVIKTSKIIIKKTQQTSPVKVKRQNKLWFIPCKTSHCRPLRAKYLELKNALWCKNQTIQFVNLTIFSSVTKRYPPLWHLWGKFKSNKRFNSILYYLYYCKTYWRSPFGTLWIFHCKIFFRVTSLPLLEAIIFVWRTSYKMPNIPAKQDKKGINAVLLGPPGAGKGTQVNSKCAIKTNTWNCLE